MDASALFAGPLTPPAEIVPATLTPSGATPRARGVARGQAAAADIARAITGYSALFSFGEIPPADQQAAAEASLAALAAWDPQQVEELTGVAEGMAAAEVSIAGRRVEPWHVALVAARTEILTLAAEAPSECSTVAYSQPGAAFGMQTWDWYAEFGDIWHYQQVTPYAPPAPEAPTSGTGATTSGTDGTGASDAEATTSGTGAAPQTPGKPGAPLAHVGFAEYGMLGKIGLNAAGVGVMLNILKNRDDAAGGVPVHAILTRVLERARSTAEAVDIITSAHTSSSSVITVVDADAAVMVEIGPHGKDVLRAGAEVRGIDGTPIGPGRPAPAPGSFPVLGGRRPEAGGAAAAGFLAHTNHFLSPHLQDGALPLSPTSMSEERIALLRARLEEWAAGADGAVAAGGSPAGGASTGHSPSGGSPAGGGVPRPETILPLMCTSAAEAPVCRVPDLSAGLGERFASLVTVVIDPRAGVIRLSPGNPNDLLAGRVEDTKVELRP